MNSNKQLKPQDFVDFSGSLIEATMGSLETPIQAFDEAKNAQAGSFTFINTPKLVSLAEESLSVCVLANLKLQPEIEKLNSKKTWLFSKNPELCARNIKKHFFLDTPYKADFKNIHPLALVDDSVKLGTNVTVGPFAVIAKNCVIGDNCFIGSHVVIEENTLLKNSVTLHPYAYIGHSCEIGNDCEVMPQAVIGSEGYGYAHDHLGNHYRVPHSGKVILHDDVHIGAATVIDRGTIRDSIIGRGTKIDNQCHLAHNTVVGKNGLLTAQLVTAGSSTIGDNFMCGGKTGITGHIDITDNVHLAGFSAVTNSIKDPGQYGGNPLLPLKQNLKVKASMTHLPEFRKQMRKVLKKVFPEEH